MQVRKTAAAEDVLFEASTANGKLLIAGDLGEVTLTITPNESTGFDWTYGKYDLEITTAAGTVYRLLRGNVSVSAEVTQ
jgi:hypothetical protein